MAQKYLDLHEIRKEMINYLRNQHILTISVRGVTTGQDKGSFSF